MSDWRGISQPEKSKLLKVHSPVLTSHFWRHQEEGMDPICSSRSSATLSTPLDSSIYSPGKYFSTKLQVRTYCLVFDLMYYFADHSQDLLKSEKQTFKKRWLYKII